MVSRREVLIYIVNERTKPQSYTLLSTLFYLIRIGPRQFLVHSFLFSFFRLLSCFSRKTQRKKFKQKEKKGKNDGNTVPNCFSFNNNLILLMFTANYPRKKLPNASVRVSFSKQKVFKCVLKRMNGTNGEYKCCEIVQVVPCFQQSPCFLRQFLPAFSTLTI